MSQLHYDKKAVWRPVAFSTLRITILHVNECSFCGVQIEPVFAIGSRQYALRQKTQAIHVRSLLKVIRCDVNK